MHVFLFYLKCNYYTCTVKVFHFWSFSPKMFHFLLKKRWWNTAANRLFRHPVGGKLAERIIYPKKIFFWKIFCFVAFVPSSKGFTCIVLQLNVHVHISEERLHHYLKIWTNKQINLQQTGLNDKYIRFNFWLVNSIKSQQHTKVQGQLGRLWDNWTLPRII